MSYETESDCVRCGATLAGTLEFSYEPHCENCLRAIARDRVEERLWATGNENFVAASPKLLKIWMQQELVRMWQCGEWHAYDTPTRYVPFT